jgi:PAS domain S-box-containing protein
MADQRTEAAEWRLAAIIESSDDAIVSNDPNGFIKSWNRAAERMFGYTEAEAVGRHITLIIPADRLAEEDFILSKIRRGERVEHFETIRQRKDGSQLPISLTVSPVRDGAGRVIGASKIARDITERTLAAARLAEAQAAQAELLRRLLTLVSASGTLLGSPGIDATVEGTVSLARELVVADAYALWRFDAYTNEWRPIATTGLSPEFIEEARAVQAPRQELSFRDPLVVDDVETSPILEVRRDAYRREGITSAIIVPLTIRGVPNGTLVFYSKHRRTFTGVEIETARALGNLAAAGITTAELYDEQRRSREQADFLGEVGTALASSLDWRRALEAVARLAVPRIGDWCTVDLKSASGEFERIAAAHRDPEKTPVAWQMQVRGAGSEPPCGVEAVVGTGHSVALPYVTETVLSEMAGGDADWVRTMQTLGLVSYMCVPIRVQDRPIGAITFASSERGRHYTDADLRFAEQVALRVGLAIENARAYQEAREASRLKDEFLATLSHELRTPLNTLLGYARMMQSGVIAEDRQARAIEVIERNATSLSQIVADVLDVSRIISGKLRLDIQQVDVGPVVREALETVRPAAEAKQIRIVTSLESMDNVVNADAARLQQVLWNLLSNGVKFTPPGGRIDIHVRQVADLVEIEVTDSGIGIAPDFLPYVFDRFRQGDSRFSREHGGLGLGLAIARHIVEMHGGRIDASSAGAGRGATFRVALPRAASSGERDSGVGIRSDVMRRRLSGLRVLAVDDQEDSLAMLRDILEAAGAQVITASAAAEAIRLIEASPPDVLLADIGMPGMDGLELIRRLRRSGVPAAKRLPAAVITAYVRSEDRAAALESGYHLHVAKPVDPNEVIRIVGSLAGR